MNNKLMSCFLAFTLLFFSNKQSNAQVIFSANFDSGGMPASFTVIDNDGLTPANNVSYFTSAWIVRGDIGNPTDSVAASTSWYNPPGIADDWMITPPVSIGQHAELRWLARAVDPDYPDGYQVLVSTTGVNVADFTDTLLTVAAENASWTERTINLMAAGYADTTIYIAFRNNSNDMFILLIDDIIVRTVPPLDVAITSIGIPDASCNLTSSELVSISLKNTGLNAVAGIPVSYQVNGGAIVTETYTDTLQPGNSVNFTFSQPADFSVKNTSFNVRAFSGLAGDGDASNDTSLSVSTINVASAHLDADGYVTSFENTSQVLGWQVEDANNDNSTWSLRGQAYDGNVSFMYLYNETNAANDWLFSTCLDATAQTAYAMKFYYKVGKSQGTVYPEKFSVHYGAAQSASAMSQLIRDFGTVNNDIYEEAVVAFKPATTGTYYVGFKCYSDPDQFYLAIDQLSIEVLQPPVASFTYAVSGLNVAFNAPAGDNLLNTLTWDFGDDSIKTVSGSGLIHTYSQYGTYYVCLTVTNLAGSDTYCDSVMVQPSGIATLNNDRSIKLFPNPARETVNIEFANQNDALITVYDLMGSVILHEKTSAARTHALNVASFPNGLYFLVLTQNEKTEVSKIIIEK